MDRPQYTKSILVDYHLSPSQFEMIFNAAARCAEDFRDPQTDEINATGIAEYVAHSFGHAEWLNDETHPVWDIAAYTAEFVEQHPRKE